MRSSDADVVIIGAGPAGLSAAAAARERGWTPLIVDAAEQVGGLWARVPPDLSCLSPRVRDRLPDGGVPDGAGPRARASDVLDAWTWFARRSEFALRLGVRVDRLVARPAGGFVLRTSEGELLTPRVIAATGEYGNPWRPALPGTFDGQVQHSSEIDWSDERAFQGERRPLRVALVGSGASASDAVERLLARGVELHLCARHELPTPPRRLPNLLEELRWHASGVPARFLPASLRCQDGAPPVEPILQDAVASGRATLHGEVVGFTTGGVRVRGAGELLVDRVVLATGFRRDLGWIEGIQVDADGVPRHEGGLSLDHAGLAYLGLSCMRTRRSGFLRGFADDAHAVVRDLAAR